MSKYSFCCRIVTGEAWHRSCFKQTLPKSFCHFFLAILPLNLLFRNISCCSGQKCLGFLNAIIFYYPIIFEIKKICPNLILLKIFILEQWFPKFIPTWTFRAMCIGVYHPKTGQNRTFGRRCLAAKC